jgi:hypothetical protein
VLGGDGTGQQVRPQRNSPGTRQHAQTNQLALGAQMVKALRPAPRLPERLLVLATDETADVESEGGAGAGVEAQRVERNSEQRPPPSRVASDRHVPDAIPVGVERFYTAELSVPHCTVRVGLKDKRRAAVVKTVDQDGDVVVGAQGRVASQLGRADLLWIPVEGVDRDVECIVIARDLDDRALTRRRPLSWLALAEIGDRIGCAPECVTQTGVERNGCWCTRDGRHSRRVIVRSPRRAVGLGARCFGADEETD